MWQPGLTVVTYCVNWFLCHFFMVPTLSQEAGSTVFHNHLLFEASVFLRRFIPWTKLQSLQAVVTVIKSKIAFCRMKSARTLSQRIATLSTSTSPSLSRWRHAWHPGRGTVTLPATRIAPPNMKQVKYLTYLCTFECTHILCTFSQF